GRRSPRARAAVLAGAALAVGLAALHPGVRARFRSGFDLEGNSDRVFLWARALEVIRDHPLAGVGFANYQNVLGPHYDRVDPAFRMRTWAHNTELSLLAEAGPLGLLALGWVAVAAARPLVRALGGRQAPAQVRERALALGGLAALACIAVIGQVHDVLYD